MKNTKANDFVNEISTEEELRNDDELHENEEVATNENFENIDYEDLSEQLKQCPKKITQTKALNNQVQKMFDNLSRTLLNSVVIAGKRGCGKTTIVEYLTQLINNQKCPMEFLGTNVVRITADCFSYQACYDEIVYTLRSIINKQIMDNNTDKIILFFENVEEFPEAFMVLYKRIMTELCYDVESLKGILEIKSEFIENNSYHNLSFIIDNVYYSLESSYKLEEIGNVLKPRIDELCKIHGVTISKKMIDYVVLMNYSKSVCEGISLEIIINLIEIALIITKNLRKGAVDNEVIEQIFGSDFKTYKKFSKKSKYRTAYHEAGHTLLALTCPKNIEFKSVKCIFDANTRTGGLTMFNLLFEEEFQSRKVTKKLCAMYLAGREAEKLLGIDNDSGSISDVEQAGNVAKGFILESGDFKSLGENCFYDFENDQFSEKTKITIEKEYRKLIKESTKYARKILSENRKFLDILAKELLKKGILSKKEVLKLWKKYKNKK